MAVISAQVAVASPTAASAMVATVAPVVVAAQAAVASPAAAPPTADSTAAQVAAMVAPTAQAVVAAIGVVAAAPVVPPMADQVAPAAAPTAPVVPAVLFALMNYRMIGRISPPAQFHFHNIYRTSKSSLPNGQVSILCSNYNSNMYGLQKVRLYSDIEKRQP